MARAYGRIWSAIWRKPEWKVLSCEAQRVYLMLITQPDISSCGVLGITMRRWTGYASDSASDSLSRALDELTDRLFLVVDWDTDEVLVRSFVKHDGGYGNSKRRPAIVEAAESVASPQIRAVLADELAKVSVPNRLSDSLSDSDSHALSDSPRSFPEPEPEPEPEPSQNHSSARAEGERPRITPHEITSFFAEFWEVYPKKVGKADALRRYTTLLKRGADRAELLAGARTYAAARRSEDPQFTAHPATWLNQGRWQDEVDTPRQSPADDATSNGWMG